MWISSLLSVILAVWVTWELGGSEYRLLLRSDVVRCDGTLQTAANSSDKIGTLVHARLGLGPHTCGIWGKPSTRHIGLNVCGRLFLRFLTHFCGFYHHLLLISFVEIFKKTGFNSLIHTFTFIHTFATQRHIIPDTDFWENLIFYIHTLMPRSVHGPEHCWWCWC